MPLTSFTLRYGNALVWQKEGKNDVVDAQLSEDKMTLTVKDRGVASRKELSVQDLVYEMHPHYSEGKPEDTV